MRSVFDPGTRRWAVRLAQWHALGLSREDMERPKIAIINSSSALAICYRHLDQVSAVVQDAVRFAGGIPFEIRTTAPSDFITSAGKGGRYVLPSRDLIVNDIEVMVEGAMLDGMVCLASCDKTTPAHLMAAARLDIPTIIVPCGYQGSGAWKGKVVDIQDVYEATGSAVTGQMSLSDLADMACNAVDGPGVCTGLGTANTMHMVAEALGMTLPGSAPIRASSPRLFHLASRAGRRIVQMVAEDWRPRRILTPAAFENAVMVTLAVAGSINAVRHLSAIATEAELDIDVVDLFDRLGQRVPVLCLVRPNGPYRIEQLEAAGGTLAVMKQLESVLNLETETVAGHSLGQVLREITVRDQEVVRPFERPFQAEPGLVILHGTLAPQGAIVKRASVPGHLRQFRGPARVFEEEEGALEALRLGHIRRGEAVVLRGLGPRGGPGTVFVSSFIAAISGAGLADHLAVITDGQVSGLNRGLSIGQVMPEAAEGGPLAFVRDGDPIFIDLEARTVDLGVQEEILRERAAKWTPPVRGLRRGWLSIYAEAVQSGRRGSVVGGR